MKQGTVFERESDFRQWFEANLDRFGVKRIILSQEPCPDYVAEMVDGRVLRIEAELFAVNFRYHRHDPSKVDLIVACYSRAESIEGVPVLAVHKLWSWEYEPSQQTPPTEPLSSHEKDLLRAVHWMGGVDLTGLGASAPGFSGDQLMWLRFSPDAVDAFPRGRDDSIFTVMRPETKAFIKKFHHALIGAGLSEAACDAVHSLQRRRLVGYRPLAFIAAVMDGGLVDHPAWLPTEIYVTKKARDEHGDLFRSMFLA